MISLPRLVLGLAVAFVVFGLAAPSQADRLEVGPDRSLKLPSDAAKIAQDGDTIAIDPGTYFDCAIWSANHLTISGGEPGTGGPTLITDKTCQGKALFVILGNDTTVRGITFARSRVVDGNGAGIRLEGRNLTVQNSQFINNQSGILSGDNLESAIIIGDSEFVDNGACQLGCVSALLVGRMRLLRVNKSRFSGTKLGHDISSEARRTELIDNVIEEGPEGTSSYLVDLPVGGTIFLDHNVLEKGQRTSNSRAAIMIGDGGELSPSGEVIASGNRFTNDTGKTVSFIVNWTDAEPVLEKNEFVGAVTPVSTSGVWIHRARVMASDIKSGLHRTAAVGFHLIKALLPGAGLAR